MMQLFERRDRFKHVTVLPASECEARLKSLKWESKWIRPHPTVKLIDTNTFAISIQSVKALVTLSPITDNSTEVAGEIWFQPTLLFVGLVFLTIITIMIFIAGNIIGALIAILVGFFIVGVTFDQYEQMKNRVLDLLTETLKLTYSPD